MANVSFNVLGDLDYPMTILNVDNLHEDVTEKMLHYIFSQSGRVSFTKIARDSRKRSKGFGFVRFTNQNSAQDALAILNSKLVNGKPMRLRLAEPDSSHAFNIVFLNNLDEKLSSFDVELCFRAFGKLLFVQVIRDDNGRSRGVAFLHYEKEEAASLAIEKINGLQVGSKKLFAGRYVRRADFKTLFDCGKAKCRDIFVQNIPLNFSHVRLGELFKRFGRILSASIVLDEKRNSRGFGFVCFLNGKEAAEAIKEMNGQEVEGHKLFVDFDKYPTRKLEKKHEKESTGKRLKPHRALPVVHPPVRPHPPTSINQKVNLYVRNLDTSILDEEFVHMFSVFGSVTSARVMTTPEGTSKGFGFVCYAEEEQAARAMMEMNGKRFRGSNGKRIYVSLAVKKEDREKMAAAKGVEIESVDKEIEPAAKQNDWTFKKNHMVDKKINTKNNYTTAKEYHTTTKRSEAAAKYNHMTVEKNYTTVKQNHTTTKQTHTTAKDKYHWYKNQTPIIPLQRQLQRA